MSKPSSLYIHIPFCKKLCGYCDFYKTMSLAKLPQVLVRTAEEMRERAPMLAGTTLKTIYFGTPTRFDPNAPIEEERIRICNYLMDSITDIAVNLPYHVVVPYANISKKDYPTNITKESK
jgi:hypothetical protein